MTRPFALGRVDTTVSHDASSCSTAACSSAGAGRVGHLAGRRCRRTASGASPWDDANATRAIASGVRTRTAVAAHPRAHTTPWCRVSPRVSRHIGHWRCGHGRCVPSTCERSAVVLWCGTVYTSCSSRSAYVARPPVLFARLAHQACVSVSPSPAHAVQWPRTVSATSNDVSSWPWSSTSRRGATADASAPRCRAGACKTASQLCRKSCS